MKVVIEKLEEWLAIQELNTNDFRVQRDQLQKQLGVVQARYEASASTVQTLRAVIAVAKDSAK